MIFTHVKRTQRETHTVRANMAENVLVVVVVVGRNNKIDLPAAVLIAR